MRYGPRMAHDARAVANFLLDYADSRKKSVSVMTLLKIIYFAHGWHLARTGEPLVRNAFEAWRHGPVIRCVYECFRGCERSPIETRASRFDAATQTRQIVAYSFTAAERNFLQGIFDAYSPFGALQLSDLTHEENSPWDQVWNAPGGKVTLGMRLSDVAIRTHFLASGPLGARH
jgi:uncharacterized phage-associated protein